MNQQTYSDDFNRANSSDLGSAYDSGYSVYSANLQIVSNRVRASALTAECLETLNTPTFANDQWAQVTLASFTGTGEQNVQIVLRAANPTTSTFYVFAAKRNAGSETSSIKRFAAATPQPTLATESITTWAGGDTMRVEAEGTALRLFRNNALLLSATDANLTAGRIGIWIYAENNLANVEIDDFTAGNIVLGARIVFARQAVHRASFF